MLGKSFEGIRSALGGVLIFGAAFLLIYFLKQSEDAPTVLRTIVSMVLWTPMAYYVFRKDKDATGVFGHLSSWAVRIIGLLAWTMLLYLFAAYGILLDDDPSLPSIPKRI